ncbi:sigma-70 family RNA polymerase sigma factor [Elstera litoralis]|uniref:sigma-70 family RNA polymerase sigma factor n=1 Tax=Elstera litoralis TaxID=552518 RepID=UPI0006986E28|nr:sigma-70 family RNA polymerase sigma factor [Elstera litoralis]
MVLSAFGRSWPRFGKPEAGAEESAVSSSAAQRFARIAAGDARAFRDLVAEQTPRLLRLAIRMLGNASDAEEVVQEALLKVWTKAALWDASRGQPETWIYSICTNLCLDRLRRPKHMVAWEEGFDPPDPTPGADADLETQARDRTIAAAIAALPDRQRAAIVLTYQEGSVTPKLPTCWRCPSQRSKQCWCGHAEP